MITGLLKRYAQAQGPRARGGVAALSGFDYQLRTYLADFTRGLADNSRDEAGANFVEALSDYTRGGEIPTVCVQVKRTLNRASLRAAAEEFVAIDTFLEAEREVSLRDEMKYEVVGKYGGGGLGWDDLSLSAETTRNSPEVVTRYEALRSAGRLLPPRLEVDPWWQLVCAAAPVLDDPFAFAREALDIALSRGLDPDGAELVRERVAERYFFHRQLAAVRPFELISPADVAPSQSPAAGFQVGRTPSLILLRDGQYMERPRRRDVALAALDALIEEREQAPWRTLDFFWIDGRSGSGKSVLLLQLMRSAVQRGAEVAWLRDRSEELAPLLDVYIDAEPSRRGPDLIFVEDFFDRQRQQSLDLGALVSRVAHRPEISWPVVVTSGPPEFHVALERETSGEGVRVCPWRLSPVDAAEAEELKTWFLALTGRQPTVGSAFQQGEGLIVSMAFEMQHGDLTPFARRFRDRLRLSGLDDKLRLPLALNRCYIWAPRDWLDATDLENLEEINRDHDFSILGTDTQHGGYLKLTHPHLGDAIYHAIRVPGGGIAYAHDLAAAFGRALDSHLPTARRLLRLVGEGHERLDELDQATLVRGFVEEWRSRPNVEEHFMPEGLAEAWVAWARWAARDPEVSEKLRVDPLAQALAVMPDDHPNWPGIFHLLWDAWLGDNRLVDAALRWLAQPTCRDVRRWSRLWETMFDHSSILAEEREQVLAVGADWLAAREDLPAWSYVWQRLLEHRSHLPATVPANQLMRAGHGWLDGREDRPEWNYVWRSLVEVRSELPEDFDRSALLRRGWQWLDSREDRPEWSHGWRSLVDVRSELPDDIGRTVLLWRGWRWLDDREDRPEWSFVWQSLVEVRSELPEDFDRAALLRRGWQWLDGREDRPDWSFVWQSFVNIPSELPADIDWAALLRRGWRWLDNREEQPDWNNIWQSLVGVRSELPKDIERAALFRRGWQWLAGREEGPDWSHVWQRLLEARHELPDDINGAELLRRGWRWLDDREDRPEWAYGWQKLVDIRSELPDDIDRAELLRRGWRWLTGREDRRVWSNVWQALFDIRSELPEDIDRAELLRRRWRWLENREEQSGWSYGWKGLVDVRSELPDDIDRAAFLRRGWQWLDGREDRPEWSNVWQALLDVRSDLPGDIDRAALLRRGLRWLDDRVEQSGWAYVWRSLVAVRSELPEDFDRAAFLRRGWQWLDGREDRPEWTYVWQALVDIRSELPGDIDRAALLRRGWQWLDGREYRPEWNYVWQALVDIQSELPDDIDSNELANKGLGFLDTRPLDRKWSFVWQRLLALADSRTQREPLLDLIERWLCHPPNRLLTNWDRLFEEALDAGRKDLPFLVVGLEWLASNRHQPQWMFLASKVSAAGFGTAQLDDLAGWIAEWFSDAAVWFADTAPHRTRAFVLGLLNPLFERAHLDGLPGWQRLAQTCRNDAVAWKRLREAFANGRAVSARVCCNVKGGFRVDVGTPAFLPGSQADLVPIQNWDALIGKTLDVHVLRLDVNLGNIIVSRRSVLEAQKDMDLTPLREAEVHEARVRGVEEYGVLVQIGEVLGLLHVSEMSPEHLAAYRRLKIGDPILIRILRVDYEKRRFAASSRELEE